MFGLRPITLGGPNNASQQPPPQFRNPNQANSVVQMLNFKPAPMLVPSMTYSGDLQRFLSNVPMFKHLNQTDINAIAGAMEIQNFQVGQTIFRQGSKGDAFYVVTQGEAGVMISNSHFLKPGTECKLTKDVKIAGRVYPRGTDCCVDKYDANRGYPFTVRVIATGDRGRCVPEELENASGGAEEVKIASLKPGDYFGDQALIKNTYRNASLVATTQLQVSVLTLPKFQQLDLPNKLHFAKRKAVMGAFDEEIARATNMDRETTKTESQAAMIKEAIMKNKYLHDLLPSLSENDINAMVRIAYKRQINKGDILIHEGDLFAEEFFVVEQGQFQFHIAGHTGSDDHKQHQFGFMGECKAGNSFGELALLYHAPRAATVTAAESGLVWVIDRVAFTNIMHQAHRAKMLEYVQVLNNIELFNPLLVDEKQAIAENLYEKHFIKGEKLMTEGEQGTMFYILLSGDVAITKNNKTVRTLQGKKGLFFGERAILKHEPRINGAVAASEDVQVACLSKHTFELILGPLEEILLEGDKRNVSKLPQAGGSTFKPDSSLINVQMSDLKRIGLLGCGGFGAVSLEQHKQTGVCYAMKQLSKGYILKCRMQKSVMAEKKILALCNSDFIVKLFATFKSRDSLYFLLEPCMGGELYATFHKMRFHGHSAKARYYVASVVYAFEHLHERHIIYRDLKPENVLIANDGKCKVTDMGLAKQTVTKTRTTCGTPDYFAPEVIDSRNGYGASVDWWTMGVFIHELMSGHAPFEASSQPQIYQKVMRGVAYVNFPYNRSDPAAVELVKAMLVHEPNERLPLLPGGTLNIKNHRWYRGFDWEGLWEGRLEVPYKPQVKSMTDISNFKVKESDIPPQLPYKDPGDGWDKDF